MAKATKAKKAKKEFQLSEQAKELIAKMHNMVVKLVTKFDKKCQKGKK